MKMKSVNVIALEKAKSEVKRLKEVVNAEKAAAKQARIQAKAEKQKAKEEKAVARAKRKAERIAQLEAKLAKLTGPAATKKAIRKPSAVKVLRPNAAGELEQVAA